MKTPTSGSHRPFWNTSLRDNKLSNAFREWLLCQHQVKAIQEQLCVDVRFDLNGQSVLAELKVCFDASTTRSIRDALGQVFEFNHYPPRELADTWLIVLDVEPSDSDKLYISTLRNKRSLPITLGWQTARSFAFHPKRAAIRDFPKQTRE